MKRCTRLPVAAFAFLGCTALVPMAYAAPQVINNCRTITQPGSYVLRDNLAASGDCLVVQADFVTIDLDGFVISGNGTGSGITDRNIARRGITVRNGTVAGFFRGIDLDGSQGVAVERVRAFSNAGHGILAGRLALVTGSVASENGIGISVEAGSTVLGNTVGRNQIGIVGNIGTSVINNTSRNNFVIGISVDCPSLVLGNTATANPTDVQLIGGGACTSEHNSTGGDPNAG